ncbi:hypothetical protein V3F56_03310 [Moorellaceae bacterium AZ2]
MFRRLVFIILLIAVVFGATSPAFAQVLTEPQSAASDDPWAPEDKGSVFEKIFAGLIGFPIRVAANLAQQGGFHTLDKLVFGEGLSEAEKNSRPWEPSEVPVVRLWFNTLATVTLPFYVLVIASTGFKLLYGSLNPAARAEAVESIQRWFLCVGIVFLAPLVVQSLMWISGILTEAIGEAFNAVAANLGRNIQDWASVSLTGEGISTGSVVGTAVVRSFLTFMFLWLNVIYIIRKFVITVMFAFTPVMAILWAINRASLAAPVWLGELATNAFMPVAHGLALSTLMLICDVKNGATWLQFTVMIYAVIPVAEALRNTLQSLIVNWAGIREEGIARSALVGALGLGGLASLVRLGAATFGGGKAAEGIKGRIPGNKPGGGLPGGDGAMRQSSPQAETPRRPIGFRVGQEEGPASPTSSGGSGPVTSGGQSVTPVPPASAGYGGVSARAETAHGGMLAGGVQEVPVPGRNGQGGAVLPDARSSYGQDAAAFQRGFYQAPGASDGQQTTPEAGARSASRPSALQRALGFGAKAGRVAAMATALTYSLVAGAIPGGEVLAEVATKTAGFVGRITGTAGYLAGSLAGQGLKKVGEKVMQNPGARAVAGRVAEVGHKVAATPGIRTAVSAGRKVGSVVASTYNQIKAVYPTLKRGGLDSWRYM